MPRSDARFDIVDRTTRQVVRRTSELDVLLRYSMTHYELVLV